MRYPAIPPKFLTGKEPLIASDGTIIGNVMDFWSWAYSDLIGNTERGTFAEYLVACALGVQNQVRITWNRYDLISPEGITIEVKASGYIQMWEQTNRSSLSFGIQPTIGWDSKTNRYDTERIRQSQIYVFCVHKHSDQETVNPLEINQWDFYLLPTRILNEKVGPQKRITLSALIKIGAEICAYENLHARIVALGKPDSSRNGNSLLDSLF